MTKYSSILRYLAGAFFLVVAVISGLFSLFTMLIAINSVNPLQTVTVRSVRVINRSGQDLLITPVGTIGRGYEGPNKMGRKHVLSQFLFEWPAIPSIMVKELPLKNGAERVITYDDEVLHFTDLVLCNRTGKCAQIEVSQYVGNRWVMNSSNRVVVVEVSSLVLAPESQTIEAVLRQPRRDWMLVEAVVAPPICLTSLAVLAILFIRRRRISVVR